MKKIVWLAILIMLIGEIKAQWSPTGAKTRFSNGIAFNSRDSTFFSAAGDSLVLTIDRNGKLLYKGANGFWSQVATGGTTLNWDSITNKPSDFPAVFKNNVTLNGPAGIRVGKYVNGQTIPAAGKTLDQFLTDIAVEAVAPSYSAPSNGIGSSPSGGSYEIGTNLGTISLSVSYNQNDGGTSTGNIFAKYISSWNNLGSNTDAITSLNASTYYRVTTSYNQGACKNNNLGVQDCSGRIVAGSVVSSNILFDPFQKRYWGFVSSSTPTDAQIRALTQDNIGTSVGLTLTNITPTGSQFLVYVRPNSGSVTSITVNGFPSTAAFTTTTRTFVNAQGYSSTYQIIISNNAQTSILNSVIYQ